MVSFGKSAGASSGVDGVCVRPYPSPSPSVVDGTSIVVLLEGAFSVGGSVFRREPVVCPFGPAWLLSCSAVECVVGLQHPLLFSRWDVGGVVCHCVLVGG